MDPLSAIIDAEDRARLATAIQQLPETERLILRLSLELDETDFYRPPGCLPPLGFRHPKTCLTEKTIGQITGIPRIKVRQALARANGMLRARLS
jgi:DNA-directed RNA polymerase specialized sigma subunit